MDYFSIYRFPIIIIGESMCGKSTLMTSFVNEDFYSMSEPTIGVDFFSKIIELDEGIKIRLQLWDTAGQERYRALTKSYYRKCMGVLLAYDVTCKLSFHRLVSWLQEAKANIPDTAIYQIVGCKCDLESKREVSRQEGEEFAVKYGLKFIETSSKDLHNVNKAFIMMAAAILERVEIGEIEASKIIPSDPLVAFGGKINQRFTKKECQLCRFA